MLGNVFALAGNVHRSAPSFSIAALFDPEKEKKEYASIQKAYGRIESRRTGSFAEWRQDQLYRRMVRYIRKYQPPNVRHYAH